MMSPHANIERTNACPSDSSSAINTDTTPPPALLRLPRELRDLIYEYYVQADGGYILNPETNKLVHADGTPICLSLALVCRQTQAEIDGLALQLNAITFTSTFVSATRKEVAAHDGIVSSILWQKRMFMSRLISQLLTAEMTETIAVAFPQFSPILDGWKANSHDAVGVLTNPYFSAGEVPSLWRDFIHYVFHQMSKHPEYVSKCQQEEERWAILPSWRSFTKFNGCRATQLSNLHQDPWRILEDQQLENLAPIAHVDVVPSNYCPHTKYTHSAAAVALRFLSSLPRQTMKSIRNVVLEETCESVSNPACHGRGFITLCKDNPKLRVRRLANLWKNVFTVSSTSRLLYTHRGSRQRESSSMHRSQLAAKDITRAVGEWIMDASALPSLGMPEDSYTLILDGGPTLDHTSRVFQTVQRDVAWQTALDVLYARGSLPTLPWLDRRMRPAYMCEGLPDALRKLSMEHALVQCNFDPGSPHDIESLLQDNIGW